MACPLKKTLSSQGTSPNDWEIYGGDSFQVEVSNPEEVFVNSSKNQSHYKMYKKTQCTMTIGIGAKQFKGTKITESNGEASSIQASN